MEINNREVVESTARTTQSIFMIAAEAPPTCEILNATCEAAISKWQQTFQQFERERCWYNQQYNVNYNPPIWRWVANGTWRIISADLLLPEDATDPTKGETPNDNAVIDLLLQRGKYASKVKNKVGARGYGYAFYKFEAIQWPSQGIMTHTARLDHFLTAWFDLAVTVREVNMPRDKILCKLMLKAVQPEDLRSRIESRMVTGLGPHKLSSKFEAWRQDAKHHLARMRRLIREHTSYLDKLNTCRANDCYDPEVISNDASTWSRNIELTTRSQLVVRKTCALTTEQPSISTAISHKRVRTHGSGKLCKRVSTLGTGREVPICCLEECDKPCHRYKHGHFATTCTREHHKLQRERQRYANRRVRTVPDS